MNKTKLLLISGISVMMGLSSCNKKDDNSSSLEEIPFSKESVEANKEKIDQAGINLVNEMDVLKDANAIEVSMNLGNFSDYPISNGPEFLMTPVKMVSGLEKSGPSEVFSQLKSVSEDPASFEEAWSQVVGTYGWNKDTDEWDFQAGGDAVIITFPGKEGDSTNTAVYTVNNLVFQNVDFPEFEDKTGMKAQVPTSLHADLKYSGTLLSTFDFEGTYQSDGFPTSLTSTLIVDDFAFVLEFSQNANKKASEKYQFKHSNKVLIEIFAEANGDWSDSNIENHTIEHSEFDYIDFETGDSIFHTWTEVEAEYIISNANAYIQAMNIKVEGIVDIEKMFKGIKDLDEEYNNPGSELTSEEIEAGTNKLAKLINDNAVLAVIDVTDNKKIAMAEAYAYEYPDDLGAGWGINMRFIFGDGSKIDYDDYFADGFGGFIDALNDVAADIGDTYDINIDPIEY